MAPLEGGWGLGVGKIAGKGWRRVTAPLLEGPYTSLGLLLVTPQAIRPNLAKPISGIHCAK